MRRQAKTCNFGIAYGVSPYGLARQLGISPARGKEFIDHFYLRYPGVRKYLDSLIAAARRDGYVSTLLGRRRTLPEITSANRNIREAAELYVEDCRDAGDPIPVEAGKEFVEIGQLLGR